MYVRLALSLAVGLLATAPAVGQSPTLPAGQRVFVAGHSFHVPMTEPLAEIAKAAGIDGHRTAGRQALGGSTVTQHWNLPDERDRARKAIRAGSVDVLTLSPHTLLPDEAIDRFTALLFEHNPTGRVTVQASWMPRDGQVGGGFTNARRDSADPVELRKVAGPWTDKLREQVRTINARYAEQFKRPVVFVVPAGDAVVRLRARVAKGDVPGIARQSDLFRDDLGHGKVPIYVLVAYCHYAVIYGRSPVGLAAPDTLARAGLGDNTTAVNRMLQEVAWAAVTAEPASGVKEAAKP